MAQAKKLSTLELLPKELQLQIFHECKSASFIFASPKLHELVGFKSIKKPLITACCRDKLLGKRQPNHAHANLRILLQESWISMEWVWEALCDWNERRAGFAYDRWLKDIQQQVTVGFDLQERMKTQLRQFLQDRRLLRGPIFRSQKLYGHPEEIKLFKQELWVNLPDSSSPDRLFGNITLSITAGRELLGGGFMICHTRAATSATIQELRVIKTGRSFLGRNANRGFVVPIRSYMVFPNRYLEGPWTQTQGDLLSFFIGHVVPSHSDGPGSASQLRKIEKGLFKAIQDGCLPGIAVLGGSVTVDWKTQLRAAQSSQGTNTGVNSQTSYIHSREIQSSEWTMANILTRSDAIAGFHWNLQHVKALIERATESRSSPLWTKLIQELYDELHSGFPERMNRQPEMLSMAKNFLTTMLHENHSAGIEERVRLKDHWKRDNGKTSAWGFSI